MLLLAALMFALSGCGGGDSGGGGGETTAAGGETTAAGGGGETTAAEGGGETTASGAGGGTTSAAGGGTTAEVLTQSFDLTPSGDSGVSGTALITNTPGGVEVNVDVQGLPSAAATEHIAHIHQGATCADDRAGAGAPVQYPLDSVISEPDATAGSATSLEGLSLEQLTSGEPKYVNVHAENTGGGVPPGIACADVTPTGGGTTN